MCSKACCLWNKTYLKLQRRGFAWVCVLFILTQFHFIDFFSLCYFSDAKDRSIRFRLNVNSKKGKPTGHYLSNIVNAFNMTSFKPFIKCDVFICLNAVYRIENNHIKTFSNGRELKKKNYFLTFKKPKNKI